MSLRYPLVARLALGLFALWPARAASAADPAAALEQLRQGYALREAGRCPEAIPHFLESERLDPRSKTLLNLADCEAKVTDLASAQMHAIEARDRARLENNPQLLQIAEERLVAIDKQLPRLTIALLPGTPADAVVSRDGTALAAVSLGIPLPTNPGPHVIVVRRVGRADKRFDVALAEGAQETVQVGVGEPTVLPPPAAPTVNVPPSSRRRFWTPRSEVSLALVVAGGAGIAVGAGFGFEATAFNGQSNEGGHCNATGCDSQGTQLRDTALRDATVSTIAIGAGAAALLGGIILWVTAPSPDSPSAQAHAQDHRRVDLRSRIAWIPELARKSGGVSIRTEW